MFLNLPTKISEILTFLNDFPLQSQIHLFFATFWQKLYLHNPVDPEKTKWSTNTLWLIFIIVIIIF